MDLYFSPAAQVELDDAFAYLEGEQPGLGYRFTADVDEALGRIRMYPLAWHPLGRNLRRCHLKHFRYGVIYRIRGEQAEVIAIAHDSRRLGYWRDRLGAN
ncbi:MAG: type II toxin-antitoxin system RelE/ParE family toxin [Sulfuritalea sp.]|nr:type II toxin-antitoxin system RelE/ParE family toxin [Sulfuritalea sp.]MDP1982620.1 type II toxin-antitoxin system RelE/ParE family toxin [Sulfuritalea sp.]